MQIKILGAGCAKCKQLEANAIEAAKQLGLQVEIEKVTDITKIAEHGVMSTPGLVINGKVKSVGKVPNVAQVMELIKEEMQ